MPRSAIGLFLRGAEIGASRERVGDNMKNITRDYEGPVMRGALYVTAGLATVVWAVVDCMDVLGIRRAALFAFGSSSRGEEGKVRL